MSYPKKCTEKPMTVADLIAALQKLDPNAITVMPLDEGGSYTITSVYVADKDDLDADFGEVVVCGFCRCPNPRMQE